MGQRDENGHYKRCKLFYKAYGRINKENDLFKMGEIVRRANELAAAARLKYDYLSHNFTKQIKQKDEN